MSPSSLRFRGYRETLDAHGLPLDEALVRVGCFDIQSGQQAMEELARVSPRPTAVFAANDPMAIGALRACREAGLRVPSDISIVGAGNIEGSQSPNPFVTTVDWPRRELGRCAASLLLGMTEQRAEAGGDLVRTFSPRLLKRQSSGAAP